MINRRQLVVMGWLVIVANVVALLVNLFGPAHTWYLGFVSVFAISIGVRVLVQMHRVPPSKQWWERK